MLLLLWLLQLLPSPWKDWALGSRRAELKHCCVALLAIAELCVAVPFLAWLAGWW